MRLLALQPYDAGSHRAFLDRWQHHSRHSFDLLTLPGRHFKWRVRQAPVAFARQVDELMREGKSWDALWCTSMLDLAALRGLCPAAADLPCAVYFHENQLTYPVRYENQRDIHFGLTNMTTALAAIACNTNRSAPCVWWNSAYNRDSFLTALTTLLEQMPDHPPLHAVEQIREASAVLYPGIDPVNVADDMRSASPPADPPTLLWAARWEHDKGPEVFFAALDELNRRGVHFRLSVIGEQFAEQPRCFAAARERFADRIDRWGYQESREDYHAALRDADLIVSTSRHEFFGLAIAEAVSAGCLPVLPDALAYPEVWADLAVYHDQSPTGVADAIDRAIALLASPPSNALSQSAERFAWSNVAPRLDDALEQLMCNR